MVLLGGIYTIRNYRTRNHASLLRELGDVVACDGHYRAGEKWQITRLIENDRYEIRNFDKPEYFASCYHRPTPGQEVYLRGLPRRQLWTIREDALGKPITAGVKTYTIFSDESGGYWNFKTEEPNSQTILTRDPPNDWSLWVFEPIEVNGHDMVGQPCTPLPVISNGRSVQTTTPETEHRRGRVDNIHDEDVAKYFDKIPRVEGAAYNSSQRDFRTGCLGGTRDYLLSTVHEWVQSPTPSLFWLNGLAGTGKTTIAHSIAEYYAERNQLGASFFYSRDQQDRRDTRQVISTIAYQLGKAYPEVGAHIAAVIRDQNPLHSNSQTQLRNLIIEPLRKSPLSTTQPTVVVIDALDESDDHTAAANMVELLATELHRTPLPMKFFVTSRPEKDLRSKFLADSVSSETRTLILHDIDVGIVQKDIKLFLQVRLTEIAKKHEDVISQKPSKWPTRAEIDALTERAGGLFIFASTVVGFLDGSSYRAPERLSSILSAKTTASDSWLNPYANLDKLYHQILEQMLHAGPDPIEDTAVMFRRVVGTIILMRERTDCEGLSSLLNTTGHIVRGALMHLHSVIKVPLEDEPNEDGDDKQIEIFHQSFHDYLTDPARCTDSRLFIDPRIQHCIIAEACLNSMINSLESALGPIIYKESPPNNFELPQWLFYACYYWTEHSLGCLPHDKLLNLTHMFFSTMSISWIQSLAISRPHHVSFMHHIEQAAQLGLAWSPFLSHCLQRLGTSLCIRYRAYDDMTDCDLFHQCSIFASVLAVGLTPAGSHCGFKFASTDLLSPVSMTSFREIGIGVNKRLNNVDQEWFENATVRAPPGSVAQTVYCHILGCAEYVMSDFKGAIEWFQKALDVPGHGHYYEILRDMVAARCNGAREERDFVSGPWSWPVRVVDSHIRVLESAGGYRADNLFTLGNLYWMRFQLLGNTSNSNSIDISIHYLQSAVNAAPPNGLKDEALLNLGLSFCTRYESFGERADIDASEQCLQQVKELSHTFNELYLHRDLGHALYKEYKLAGQCEDLAKSIWHLKQNTYIFHDGDPLSGNYIKEAYNALEELGQIDPDECIEIWRYCHDPDDPVDIQVLNDMMTDPSYRFQVCDVRDNNEVDSKIMHFTQRTSRIDGNRSASILS